MLSIIKFYSDSCGPCKTMVPVVEQVKELESDVIVTDINIADNPGLVQQHFVRAVPTFVMFKDAIEVSRKVGAFPLSDFREWIEEFRSVNPTVVQHPDGAQSIELVADEPEKDA